MWNIDVIWVVSVPVLTEWFSCAQVYFEQYWAWCDRCQKQRSSKVIYPQGERVHTSCCRIQDCVFYFVLYARADDGALSNPSLPIPGHAP